MLAGRLVDVDLEVGAPVTVIAAVVDHDAGRVHMAADSIATDHNGTTMEVAKLWSPAEGVVLGVAGSSMAIPLVRRHVRIEPPVGDDDPDEWAQDFAESVTRELCARGCIVNGDVNDFYGVILLAWRGHLWEVQTNVAIRVTRGYHAIGSGDEVAFGAMWALMPKHVHASPSSIPTLAVQAAIEHRVDIGGRIDTAAT